jgi:hypothetical protein
MNDQPEPTRTEEARVPEHQAMRGPGHEGAAELLDEVLHDA